VLHQSLAGGVDVIDRIREMTERTPYPVSLRVPVPGELDLRVVVARRRENTSV